jgi:formate hydrogenlyase subunit 4
LNVEGVTFSPSTIDLVLFSRKSSSEISRKSFAYRWVKLMLFFQRFFSISAIEVGAAFLMNLYSDLMALAFRGTLDLMARSISHLSSGSAWAVWGLSKYVFLSLFKSAFSFALWAAAAFSRSRRSFSLRSFSAFSAASLAAFLAACSASFCFKFWAPA